MKIRHPEKINTSDKLSPLKPNWLKKKPKPNKHTKNTNKTTKT
jgi:hypothetical protein